MAENPNRDRWFDGGSDAPTPGLGNDGVIATPGTIPGFAFPPPQNIDDRSIQDQADAIGGQVVTQPDVEPLRNEDDGSIVSWVRDVLGRDTAVAARVTALEGRIAIGAEFFDNFNRGDNSSSLGNGWVQGGTGQALGIDDQAAQLDRGSLLPSEGRRWAKSPTDSSADDVTVSAVIHPRGTPKAPCTSLFLRCNPDFTQGVYVNLFGGKCYMGRFTRSGNSWTFTDFPGDGGRNLSKSYSNSATVEFKAEGNRYQLVIDSKVLIDYTDTANTVPTGAGFRSNGFACQTWTALAAVPQFSGGLASYAVRSQVSLTSVSQQASVAATAAATEAVAPVAAAAQEASQTAAAIGTQVEYVQQAIAVQSGMGVWETGPDRTGTVSFPFVMLAPYLHSHTGTIADANLGSHNHGNTGLTDGHRHSTSNEALGSHSHGLTIDQGTVPTVACTASYAPWALVIFKTQAERKVFTYLAWKTGTVSTFYLDLYRQNADGSSTFTGYTSPNLAGDLSAVLTWQQHLMTDVINADVGDVYEVQFRMTGSGTVFLAGINWPYPNPIPGLRPYTGGAGRNPSTATPASIATATRDSMYTGPTPFLSLGIDIGQVNLPRTFYDNFNTNSWNNWVRSTSAGQLSISNGRVTYGGSSDGYQAGCYAYQTSTDQQSVQIDIVETKQLGGGLFLCGSSTPAWNNGASLSVYDEAAKLYANGTEVASYTGSVGAGTYILRYNPTTNTFEVLRLNSDGTTWAVLISWVDAGNVIQHGRGRRFGGIWIRRQLFTNSSALDNFYLSDWA
ncbi:hypothetical protein [Gordonia soli]|uniref:Minor tail protein n=1 Tax=Gordonia soli NBRC 108243 TaxID=1223545 RepID=M0QRP4_9ACTN|nr:hypothetical protein [Gordonia soli]GAC71046.1 hypothetical protein GS4_47_00360 [Gordonia soli NBRC 108243]